ncbi:MAG: hypothetical protein CL866_02880 [Cycloclasticus sp.]|nr:hypothetical protein [Cycloclasticus sp.]MBG95800.1 hypothetical protein [Cycloclasticus sp.]|tara:strand:- start:195 stop:773 length:579 start_codon:yes stop_codon:yes gene_type:complete
MYEEPFEYRSMPKSKDDWIAQRLKDKENAYNGGCLGALADAIQICKKNETPLPKWVADEATTAVFILSTNDKGHLKKWRNWFTQYEKDMADIDLYYSVKEAREHGAAWADIYDIAASLVSNRIDENRTEAVKKAYKRTVKRLKAAPFRYHYLTSFKKPDRSAAPTEESHKLWQWVGDNIKTGKARKTGKSKI